jgi:hypothetical protein
MGSHAKPRTPGRKTAIGALALGATLTGVGLTAAALDPATAVLTASGTDGGGSTQLSGLSDPVGLNLSPAADDITNLTSAPLGLGGVASTTNGVNGTASGALESVGGLTKTLTSGTLDVSTKAPGTQNAIKPIAASALTASRPAGGSSTGSAAPAASSGGYTGKHAKARSAPAPAAGTPLASSAASGLASSAGAVLPLAQGLLSKVPVVSSLVQGTGLTGTAGGLLGTATGTVGGTATGTSGDPVGGLVGSLPLVGTLLGGSGDGQSTLSVPNVSALTGSLGGLV